MAGLFDGDEAEELPNGSPGSHKGGPIDVIDALNDMYFDRGLHHLLPDGTV